VSPLFCTVSPLDPYIQASEECYKPLLAVPWAHGLISRGTIEPLARVLNLPALSVLNHSTANCYVLRSGQGATACQKIEKASPSRFLAAPGLVAPLYTTVTYA